MVKEGDILIFKRNLSEWKEGDICECISSIKSNNIFLFLIKNLRSGKESSWCSDYEGPLYIYNWFYDLSEWRDRQIDILND